MCDPSEGTGTSSLRLSTLTIASWRQATFEHHDQRPHAVGAHVA
jgi:hypothetical protein